MVGEGAGRGMSGDLPAGSVSLDADNLWSYLKTHGDDAWRGWPSYLDRFVPLALDALDEVGLRITFFVVGRDAELAPDREVLRSIVEAGHQVGNHSFEHEPWLHRYTREAIAAEISRAEDAIAASTGERPTGFRGPGFSWSADVLDVLAERGYRYDASTLPTFVGPLARAYYFRSTRLTPGQREERAALFGGFREGLRPTRPYRWQLASGRSLLEIPVSTVPVVKTPFHLTYLLYLSRISERLMWAYLRSAIAAHQALGTGPSFLLHPLDLLSGENVPELRFFPGMDLPAARKRDLFVRVLLLLREHFTLGPMATHADALEAQSPARLRLRMAVA